MLQVLTMMRSASFALPVCAVSRAFEKFRQLLGVVDVHLAAEGPNEQFFCGQDSSSDSDMLPGSFLLQPRPGSQSYSGRTPEGLPGCPLSFPDLRGTCDAPVRLGQADPSHPFFVFFSNTRIRKKSYLPFLRRASTLFDKTTSHQPRKARGERWARATLEEAT